MRADLDDRLRIALQDAGEHLAELPEAFVMLFKRGDLSVELFAPHEVDTQQPHEQDEIYIVAAGTGVFRRNAERVPFGPGDFLFVAAGVPHAFETFTDDFKTWVIFFGPKGGYGGSGG
jgi:mannose-6-phosphate isomerase-like protein (cupin superfamily)